MTRHSRNCTANSVYSYHEKKKDAEASGYGTLAARYGKDGVKDFDCCCLSLHPCRDPVISEDGYLFEREAIIEYILKKKGEIRRKMKEFEKQEKKEEEQLKELGAAEHQSKLQKLISNSKISGTSVASQDTDSSSSSSGSSVSNMAGGLDKKLPSFWVPSLTPDNKQTKLTKPDQKVLCPMSGKAIKMKDFISVKFTKADASASSSCLEGRKDRFKCPVTGDILRNSVPCAVLRQTGDVITMEAVKLIKKDMKHPLTGQNMTEKDIIVMQRGGTGFAEANENLAGNKPRPVMQA